MEDNFSEKYKKNMIAIFVNSHTCYIRSYNIGTKEIIVEKYLKKFLYGNPLFMFMATAETILACREKEIDAHIFTTYVVAQWLCEKKCNSEMPNRDAKLKQEVSEISKKLFSKEISNVKIWNDIKWGPVRCSVGGNTFEIKEQDILSYRSPYAKQPKKVKRKPGDIWPSIGW